jgi:hypothetical protein
MQALESRVAYLEGLLQDARPDLAADHMNHSSHQLSERGGGSFPAMDNHSHMLASPPLYSDVQESRPAEMRELQSGHLSNAEATETGPVSSEVGLLCVNASGREPQYLGSSSALSFAQIATNTMGLQGDAFNQKPIWAHAPDLDRQRGRNQAIDLKHPAKEVAEVLSKAFFENIHPQYPFLHQPTFALWERECQDADVSGSLHDVGHTSIFFVTMVYAIGSIALSHGLSGDAEDFYAMAMQYSSSVLNTDTLESVQALIACAVFSIRSPVGASLWMISGMALRKSIGLGYHRSFHRLRRKSGALSQEMAKRCFWVAYDIDRVTSFILGRPSAISDQAIDVEVWSPLPSIVGIYRSPNHFADSFVHQLPLNVNDDDLIDTQQLQNAGEHSAEITTTMTGAIHIIKLRRLWSRVHSLLYGEAMPCLQRSTDMNSTVRDLRQELETWRRSTPLQTRSETARPLSVYMSSEWFTLAYNHSVLLLYRPFINDSAEQGTSTQTYPELTETAFDECYGNSQRICMTYRCLYQQPSIQFTWGSLHILFLGGMTYLYCLWRSAKIRNTARFRDVMSTCMACSMVLVIVAERWGIATAYRDIFEKLSERTINMLELEASKRMQTRSDNPVATPGFDELLNDTVPFDEWIRELDNAGMPPESDWLVQEILDGVREFGPNGLDDL